MAEQNKAFKILPGISKAAAVFFGVPPPDLNLSLPGCMVDEGLGLVLGELVGDELVDGGDSRPAVFCGCACWRTFKCHWLSRALSWQLGELVTLPLGLHAKANTRTVHKESYTAFLSAGGSTDPVAWRWGAARPPLWSQGTGACRQPSHRIYSLPP